MPDADTNGRVIRFGVFEVDLAARTLRKRGVRVTLQEQPFRLLTALLERPGEIVSREEIKEKLWPDDTFVDFDKSLNTAAQKVRKALGDSAESPRFLETVPRQGYRWLAPLESSPIREESDLTPAPEPPASPWRVVAIAAAAAVAGLAAGAILFPDSESETVEVPNLRFAIEPRGVVESAAISPDGRAVAYTASVDDSKPGLFVHDLSQDVPRDLGVDGHLFDVVWSSDSETLFVRQGPGRILRILAAGGPAQEIFHRPDGIRDLSFDPVEDRVVFAVGVPQKLYAVSPRGGEAEPLFPDGSPVGEPDVPIYFASFARPAGRPLALLNYGAFAVPRSIAAYAPGSERAEVLGLGFWPVYSQGYVLYRAGGQGIWAAPFSPDKLQLTGNPFPVEPRGLQPTVSRTGALAFVESQPGGRAQLVWKDRTGETLGTIGQPQTDIALPVLSPDGSQVVVVARDNATLNASDVWVHSVATPLKTRLTFTEDNEDRPTWLPDGKSVSYSSVVQTAMDVFTLSTAAGSKPEPLVAGEGSQFVFDWTPDGSVAVYDTPPQDIWVLEIQPDGARATRPLIADPFDTHSPDLSPDGRFLAYVSNESGREEVYVRPFPEGGVRIQVSLEGGRQPRWRGDGEEIYYVDDSSTLIAAEVRYPGGPRIVSRTPLFSDAYAFRPRGQRYDVSQDGRRFVVVEQVEPPPPPKIRIVQNWVAKYRGE